MKYSEKIGIVTVLYKSETVVEDFFLTLNEQSYNNFILYVVDNKSPDGSLEKSKYLALRCNFQTRFIENSDNYGVAKGNNQGIEAALSEACDFVLLSNNDVVLRPDAIEKLYFGLKETNADMAVPKIYFYNTKLIWAAGGKFTKYNGSTKHFGNRNIDNGDFEKSRRVDYAPTCFMLICRNIFETIGLMDEKYFVYYDDTDFMYRSKKKQKILFYIHDSVIEHKESTSTGIRSDFSEYYMMRNRIYFAKKHRRFFFLFYIENILFHYLFRFFKISNIRKWRLLLKAIYDGYKL
jgi:GT2 family glycosyltransferase